jgi:glycosyltransferase involved in cell wall biosynthesis
MGAFVSIIVCTRNRAENLRASLHEIGNLVVPEGWHVELLVVDNGSTDHTRAVINEVGLNKMNLRYISEPKTGVSNARNTGLAATQGEIILFIDDDLLPDRDWLWRIGTPLMDGKCDAAVATVRLAEHLQRPWLEPVHKAWLAAPDLAEDIELELTGASMGFHRTILKRVPAFDPELGGGAMGFGEDTLFSWQLCEAGYRLHRVPDALAIHHPEPARLLRSQWLAAASKRGPTVAYLLHHWQHGEVRNPLMRAYYFAAKLRLRRILQPPVSMDTEGCAPWEMSYVLTIEKCRHFLKERRRRRNYSKRGLVRLDLGLANRPTATESRP